jgi:hypothetical protein
MAVVVVAASAPAWAASPTTTGAAKPLPPKTTTSVAVTTTVRQPAPSGGEARPVVIHDGTPWYAPVIAALVWPILLVLILSPLASRRGRAWARQLGGRVDSVDVFGVVGLKLSEETSGRIKRTIQTLINDYREESDRSLARLASRAELETKLKELATQHIQKNMVDGDFRCAIYVQDLLMDEGIAQVTNYYPDFTAGAGRVIGRWFGFVGRVFRSGKSRTEGNVTDDPALLVDEYGMTPGEAAPSPNRPPRRSFSCVLLPMGALKAQVAVYVDSVHKDAFAVPAAAFEEAVRAGAHDVGMTEALVGLVAEIQAIGLDVDVKLARDR